MADFESRDTRDGFACKLWRGERMTLLGFDVAAPEDDFVGFSVEVRRPGAQDFLPLRNRLAFAYDRPAPEAVSGERQFDSREAPFQKFRWIHFPWQPVDGTYTYRVAKRHMRRDGTVVAGITLTLGIEQTAVTYDGLVDVGFTRNFASSQAYREQFGNNPDIIPEEAADGLDFVRPDLTNDRGESVYAWLGFEARDLILGFLEDTLRDPGLTIDVMAYDLNEPDILDRLERFGDRLRAIIDDSGGTKEDSHALPRSAESRAAKRLRASAGRGAVRRTHFSNLQHHKVLIARRGGVAERVLCGSTNFTFRGLYIQANNVLVFSAPEVAGLFGRMFELAFEDPEGFRKDPFSKAWHLANVPGKPAVQVCFSPHAEPELALNPVAAAMDQATSSVFYSVAFLSQMTSGPTRAAFDRLMGRPVFSYGTVDRRGGLELRKPDGSVGLVDFAYLAGKAPEPFAAEWSGGKGRNIHHKFVVTDFSLPTAKLFTGSSNLSPSGERGNGDHLIMIADRRIATAYAIEGARVFDHLQFRNRMRDAFGARDERLRRATVPRAITLRRPVALSGDRAPWFARFYEAGSQAERDRLLFSR